MSLLNEASFLVTPNGYKEDKLYAAIPTNGNGDMTVTRATAATRVDENGLVSSVASNVPRIDYTGGGCPSILLEPQRTNLFTYSEQFDNVAWSKTRCTIDENSTNSPNGTLTADTLIGNSVAGENYIYLSQNATIGVPNVLSVYIKPIEITLVSLVSFNQAGRASFSLVGSGSVTFENGICTNSTIESLPNGWYRISTKITPTATASNNIGIATSTFGIVGNCFYLWGAQLEAGAYPTSYIPTTTATVTRVADVCVKTGISDLIGQTEGVLFIETAALFNDLTQRSTSISDGTGNNRLIIYYNSPSNQILAWGVANGVLFPAAISYTVTDETEFAKIAVRYRANDITLWVNGKKRGTDITSQALPINFSKFGFDGGVGFTKLFAKVKSAQLYKTYLHDDEMATLTNL
jgi:hypothetical protein